MLEQELRFFEEHRAEWLEDHRGALALVKGGELLGFFDSQADALSEGARLFGLDHFLVRAVEADERVESAPALTLGILRANA